MSEDRRRIGSEDSAKVRQTVPESNPKESKNTEAKDDKKTREYTEKPAKKMKKTTVGLIAALVSAGVVVGGYFGLVAAGVFENIFEPNTASAEELVVDDGTIYDGVTCLGVELGGAKKDDAAKLEELEKAANELIKNINFEVTVSDEHTIYLSGHAIDAGIDIAACMDSAYAYGRQGSISERRAAVDSAAAAPQEIDYSVSFDEKFLIREVNNELKTLGVGYRDADIEIVELEDEEALTTALEVNIIGESDGIEVDMTDLSSKVKAALDAKDYTAVIAPATKVSEAEVTAEDIENIYCKQGTFSTEYSDSNSNRKYNIWKMAAIINGVVIEPGETWSINEEAGPRTYELGWKGANGINNGEYKIEAGGGICQTSSTLYNACLMTELDIVDRSHHSWPLGYVDAGLDATISTGSPDFKIRNPYDTPIIISAECDVSKSIIYVSIYCPKMEYTLKFSGEIVSSSYSGARRDVEDPTMAPGTERLVQKEHPRVVANVYVEKFDLEGNAIGEKELYYTDTYSNKPAIYYVGPAAPAAPETPAAPTTPAEPTTPTTPVEPTTPTTPVEPTTPTTPVEPTTPTTPTEPTTPATPADPATP